MPQVYYVGDHGQKLTAAMTDVCPTCNGTGRVAGVTCVTCAGTGRIPYDLTGYAVTFIFQRRDGTVVEKAGVVEVPPADGLASYTWLTGDLDIDGRWLAVLRAVTPVPPAVAVTTSHGEFEFFLRRVPV